MAIPRQSIRPSTAAGALARHFLSDDLPESLQPTPSEHRLQVAVIWGGDQVVELAEATPGKPFTIGPRGASLEVFHNLPVFGAFPLVTWTPEGASVLLPQAAQPVVRTNKDRSLAELIAEGCAEQMDVPVAGARYTLGLTERVTLHFGSLKLALRYARPQMMARRPLLARIDDRFVSMMVILFMTAFIVTRMIAITPPPEQMSDDLLQKGRASTEIFIVKTLPPVPVKTNGGASAAGVAGKIGKLNVPPHNAAPSPPHKSQEQQDHDVVAHALEVFNAAGAAGDVLGPAGQDDAINKAFGGVTPGAATADAGGLGGLTSRGSGPGGGDGPIGIPGFGNHHGHGHGNGAGDYSLCKGANCIAKPSAPLPPSIPHLEDDPGYREVIARVVRRHWNEIKYCYEKELNHDPSLEGKVATHFVIGGGGQVLAAEIRETSLGNASAEHCIVGVLQRMSFPPPKTSFVEVNYPFLFALAQ